MLFDKVYSQRKVEVQYCEKDHCFYELQLVISDFADVSVNFCTKVATEFTVTAAVFK